MFKEKDIKAEQTMMMEIIQNTEAEDGDQCSVLYKFGRIANR